MKKKLVKFLFLIGMFFVSSNFCLAQAKEEVSCEMTAGKYKLLEGVPFVASACSEITFPQYISRVYIFAISAIGVASLLMITIGGGYYLLAAGNASTIGTAKTIIKDALLGLIVAFLSYLLLWTINPDILSGRLDMRIFGGMYDQPGEGTTTDPQCGYGLHKSDEKLSCKCMPGAVFRNCAISTLQDGTKYAQWDCQGAPGYIEEDCNLKENSGQR
jgi:hypothetical protein